MLHRPKLLRRKPNPKRRPSLSWSKSGGPAAVRRSAARITIATASVITAAPRGRRAGSRSRRAAPRATPREQQRHRRGRRDNNEFRKPREGAPAEAAALPASLHAGKREGARARRAQETASGSSLARAFRRQGPRQRRSPRQIRSQQGRPQQGRRSRRARQGPRFRRATRAAATARQRPVAPSICDQRQPARARSSGRSQFAVRQTRGAEGTTRRPQGVTRRVSRELVWSGSVSTNGCGMRGW